MDHKQENQLTPEAIEVLVEYISYLATNLAVINQQFAIYEKPQFDPAKAYKGLFKASLKSIKEYNQAHIEGLLVIEYALKNSNNPAVITDFVERTKKELELVKNARETPK